NALSILWPPPGFAGPRPRRGVELRIQAPGAVPASLGRSSGRERMRAMGQLRRWSLLALCLPPAWVFAADWPHWRGPNRNDRVAEDSGWSSHAWPLEKPLW